MSVTIFWQTKRGVKRFSFNKAFLLVPFIAVLAAIWHFQFADVSNHKQYQQRLNQQRNSALRDEIDQVKVETEQQLAMLTSRLAMLQAKMIRIEAVGTELAERSDLTDEFSFDGDVGLGGLSTDGEYIEVRDLLKEMDKLAKRIEFGTDSLLLLETVTRNLHIDRQKYISGRPIGKGWLSSHFGIRNDPFTGKRTMHKGVDFAGKEGSEVIATAAGVVSWAGEMFGYGQLVEIDHGNGFKTRYGHNKSISVKLGEIVDKGEPIALMGSTGRSTGPHVHYEILKNGKQIDPRRYVYRKAK